jgi:ribosomal protein L23
MAPRFVFLPEMAMTLVRRVTARLPHNHYLFRVDPKYTKSEVREYLEKVYDVKVGLVTTSISLGETTACSLFFSNGRGCRNGGVGSDFAGHSRRPACAPAPASFVRCIGVSSARADAEDAPTMRAPSPSPLPSPLTLPPLLPPRRAGKTRRIPGKKQMFHKLKDYKRVLVRVADAGQAAAARGAAPPVLKTAQLR